MMKIFSVVLHQPSWLPSIAMVTGCCSLNGCWVASHIAGGSEWQNLITSLTSLRENKWPLFSLWTLNKKIPAIKECLCPQFKFFFTDGPADVSRCYRQNTTKFTVECRALNLHTIAPVSINQSSSLSPWYLFSYFSSVLSLIPPSFSLVLCN